MIPNQRHAPHLSPLRRCLALGAQHEGHLRDSHHAWSFPQVPSPRNLGVPRPTPCQPLPFGRAIEFRTQRFVTVTWPFTTPLRFVLLRLLACPFASFAVKSPSPCFGQNAIPCAHAILGGFPFASEEEEYTSPVDCQEENHDTTVFPSRDAPATASQAFVPGGASETYTMPNGAIVGQRISP